MAGYVYARSLRKPSKRYTEKQPLKVSGSKLIRLVLSSPKLNSQNILNYSPFN